MNVATIAAFAAAGISLLNVFVTSRLTQRGQREQWKRETERPIVANLLTVSQSCLDYWSEAAELKEAWARSREPGAPPGGELWDKMLKASAEAWASHEKLRLLVAELDLVAGVDVRRAAEMLEKRLERIRYPLNPAGGNQNPSAAVYDARAELLGLRAEVINAARRDIGVDDSSMGLRRPARLAIWPGRNDG